MNAPDSWRCAPAADVGGFGGRVKSRIWSGWLWWSFFLLNLPLSLRRYRHLFALSLQLSSKKSRRTSDAWNRRRRGTGRGAEPSAPLSHNNLHEAAGPRASGEKYRKSASTLDSLLSLCDFDMCDMHQRPCSFQLAWIYPSVCCVKGEKGTVLLDLQVKVVYVLRPSSLKLQLRPLFIASSPTFPWCHPPL